MNTETALHNLWFVCLATQRRRFQDPRRVCEEAASQYVEELRRIAASVPQFERQVARRVEEFKSQRLENRAQLEIVE